LRDTQDRQNHPFILFFCLRKGKHAADLVCAYLCVYTYGRDRIRGLKKEGTVTFNSVINKTVRKLLHV